MAYNMKLYMLGLPALENIRDFSDLTHVSARTIFNLSIHSDKYYKTFTIPKKSGKPRTISQPARALKGLQSWILVHILNKLSVSEACKGFEAGSSTKDNAIPHIGANNMLSLDLKDFFPTVKRNQVYNIFKALGYNNVMCAMFTNICSFQGALPQGSPCSPKLANLSASSLDVRIKGYVEKRGIKYTRYADDLTFSGMHPEQLVKILPMVKHIIREENFEINPEKTRVAGASKAKSVTGLIVTHDAVGVGKEQFKKIRAKIQHLTLPSEQSNSKLLFEVGGWLSYLNSVDKKRLLKANKYISELSQKHPGTLVTNLA